jgi:hypothetical protein
VKAAKTRFIGGCSLSSSKNAHSIYGRFSSEEVQLPALATWINSATHLAVRRTFGFEQPP